MIDGPIKLGLYRVDHHKLLSVGPDGGTQEDIHFLILNSNLTKGWW